MDKISAHRSLPSTFSSLLAIPCSLFPTRYSLLPISCKWYNDSQARRKGKGCEEVDDADD